MMIKVPWNTPKIKINSVHYQRLGMCTALKICYLLRGTFVFLHRQLREEENRGTINEWSGCNTALIP